MKDETPRREEAPLLELLGEKPAFLPDEEAPPVDEPKIARFVAGQLTGLDAVEVEFAIRSYRPWYWAWSRAIARAAGA
jgi:hypothetical protein